MLSSHLDTAQVNLLEELDTAGSELISKLRALLVLPPTNLRIDAPESETRSECVRAVGGVVVAGYIAGTCTSRSGASGGTGWGRRRSTSRGRSGCPRRAAISAGR